MSICQIEERDAGRPYPRTCPTCGLTGSCAKGLDREGLRAHIATLEAQLAERVRVKPLQWNECRALYGGRKLVATDCFGREYARLDLKGQPDDFISDFKARVQEAYNTAILSALEATPAPMVTFPGCVVSLNGTKISMAFETDEDAQTVFRLIEHIIDSTASEAK